MDTLRKALSGGPAHQFIIMIRNNSKTGLVSTLEGRLDRCLSTDLPIHPSLEYQATGDLQLSNLLSPITPSTSWGFQSPDGRTKGIRFNPQHTHTHTHTAENIVSRR